MIKVGAEITTDSKALERDLRQDARVIESTIGGAFKTVEAAAAAPFKVVSKLSRSVTDLFGKVTSLESVVRGTALGLAGAFVIRRIDDAIDRAGALEVQLKGIANQTGYTRREVNGFVADVNNASAGLLDFQVSSSVVNRALLAQIPPQAIERLTRYAAQVAVARGEQDRFTEQLPQLVKTIAGGETGLLKDFGVFIDPADLQGISFAERNAKILQLTLDQLEAKSNKLGTTGKEIFFVYTSIFGNIEDIRTSLSKTILENEKVAKAVKYVADLTGGIAATLRREDPGALLGALFEKLIQVAGALSVDLGEAIGIGIARGIRMAIDALGFDLAEILGEDGAQRFNQFADRPIDFNRTGQRLGELRDNVTAPDAEDVGRADLQGRELRNALNELRRLQAEQRRRDRAGGGPAPGELTRIARQIRQERRDAGQPVPTGSELRELSLERFNRQNDPTGIQDRIDELTQATGGVGPDANRLRQLNRELDRGRGGNINREVLRIRQKLLDQGVSGKNIDLDTVRQQALENIRKQRDELVNATGIADVRTVQEKVDDTTGADEGDSLGQRLGKALVSGIATGSESLRAEFVAAIDEGIGVGIAKITDEVAGWGTTAAEAIWDFLKSQDWASLGEQIIAGIYTKLKDTPLGKTLGKAADAGDYISDQANDIATNPQRFPITKGAYQELENLVVPKDEAAADVANTLGSILDILSTTGVKIGEPTTPTAPATAPAPTPAQPNNSGRDAADTTSAINRTAEYLAMIAERAKHLMGTAEALALDLDRTADAMG